MDDTTEYDIAESPAMQALRREIADALMIDIGHRLETEPDSVEFCRWLSKRMYDDTKRLCRLALDENPDWPL